MVNYNEMTTTKLREALEVLAAERIKQYGQNGTPNGDEQAANAEFFYRKKEWDEYKTALKEREDLVVQMKEKPDGKNGGQGQIGSLAILDDKIKKLTDQIKIDNKDAGVDFDKLFAQSEDIKLVKTELTSSKESAVPAKLKSARDYDKMTTAKLQEAMEKLAAERIEKRGTSGQIGEEEQTAKSEYMYRLKEAEQIAELKKERDDLVVKMKENPDGKGSGQGQVGSLRVAEDKLATLQKQSDIDNRTVKGNRDIATDSNQVVGQVGTLVAAAGDLATLGLSFGSTAPKKDSAPKTKQLTEKEKEERVAFAGIQSMVGMPKDKQDGLPGGETTAAIKLAQKIFGLKETGNFDDTTQLAIIAHVKKTGEHMSETVAKYKAEPKAALSSLSESIMKSVECALAGKVSPEGGTYTKNVYGVDGKASAADVNNVKAFQKDNGLIPDGLASGKLFKALGIKGGEAAGFFSPQESPDTAVAKGNNTRGK